jgi:hypothetical protein
MHRAHRDWKNRKQFTISSLQIGRLGDVEHGREFHQTLCVSRRVIQVADKRKIFFAGIDRKRSNTEEPLVRPVAPKDLPPAKGVLPSISMRI